MLTMDLLITGANGFLGSQIATRWLHGDAEARIACLVRGRDEAEARGRLHAALRQAVLDQAMDADVEDMLSRTCVICGDLADPAWIDRARAWLRGPAELFHCAANLSFREADRAAVWRTNVEGTRALLRALPAMPEIAACNYVSTAYVAGNRQGRIMEGEHARPDRFNNPYEESKWIAETLVRDACGTAGIAWRIFRPSIIIAHSVTHRMSAQSGFYQVVNTMMQFGRQDRARRAGRILLPVPEGTTLDLIPVDVVVTEILALMALGGATRDQTYHITSESPLPLAEVLAELSPMSGVSVGVGGTSAPEAVAAAGVMMRRLRYYMPYFSFVRRFDRRNAPPCGAARPFRLDVEQLRGFVQSYVAEHARLPEAAA